MKKLRNLLFFLCVFLCSYNSRAAETDEQPKLPSTMREWFIQAAQKGRNTFSSLCNTCTTTAQNARTKFNNIRGIATAYKWIKEHPVTTLTVSDIINWTNSHPIATGSIISAVTITSIYGTYRLTKDLIQKLRTKI